MNNIKIKYYYESGDMVRSKVRELKEMENIMKSERGWTIIGRHLFSGKIDKNGVEIYDGDIIRDSSGDTQVVFWDKRITGFWKKPLDDKEGKYKSGVLNMEYWQVVSNIYEQARSKEE